MNWIATSFEKHWQYPKGQYTYSKYLRGTQASGQMAMEIRILV